MWHISHHSIIEIASILITLTSCLLRIKVKALYCDHNLEREQIPHSGAQSESRCMVDYIRIAKKYSSLSVNHLRQFLK